MTIESIIFDIDGTLWDSRALVAEGYNSQLRQEGYDHLCVTPEDLKPLFGKTMTEIADILFASLPVPLRYELLERCMEAENNHLHTSPCDNLAYPGIREAMEQLGKEYRLFIVSNSQQGYPEVCMDKMGIGHLIQGHLCFGDTGTEKGLTILELMRRHNITDAVYIGDTQGDYEATVVAGVPFVWAAYGFGTPAGFAARADHASALPQAIKEL
jgi:phosphoglycolate phosphatase